MNLRPTQYQIKVSQTGGVKRLSPAELKVCCLVELSDKQIADVLDMSVHTVRTHLKSAARKTGASSRTALRLIVIQQEPSEYEALKRLRNLGAA